MFSLHTFLCENLQSCSTQGHRLNWFRKLAVGQSALVKCRGVFFPPLKGALYCECTLGEKDGGLKHSTLHGRHSERLIVGKLRWRSSKMWGRWTWWLLQQVCLMRSDPWVRRVRALRPAPVQFSHICHSFLFKPQFRISHILNVIYLPKKQTNFTMVFM